MGEKNKNSYLEPTETKVNFGRILRPQFEGLEASKWSQVYWDPKS